jgi:hypothetical protein
MINQKARERYNDDSAANLADTTQVESNSSMHVTARNIGCLDPFSVLTVEVISACRLCVVFVPCDVRDHRVFGSRRSRHSRGTVRMGLLQAG